MAEPVIIGIPRGKPPRVNPATGTIRAHNVDIASRNDAEDGSRRLAARICQYHAKHADSIEKRNWWARRGKEISFG